MSGRRCPRSSSAARPGATTSRTHDEAWYRDHEVELLLATRASTLDPATRTVTTEVGDQLRYGTGLVLATGAQPVRLELPGGDLEGVYYLRTVDDAERLRAAISRAESMVILGGGFIGAEVAASATQMDTRVTLLERADTLWTRAVGPEMGRFFEAFLRDRGVHVRTRTRAERIEGRDSVEAVVLPDGTRLAADLVVIGVGVRPDTDLAERAGLPVDNGILVDQQLRAADGVFAAGDVANAEHPLFGRIRIEHWAEALNQGLLAGRNLAGAGEPLRPHPLLLLRPVRPVTVLPGPRPGMGRAGGAGQPRGRRAQVRRLVPARRHPSGGPDRQRLGRRGPGARGHPGRSAGGPRTAPRARRIKGPPRHPGGPRQREGPQTA